MPINWNCNLPNGTNSGNGTVVNKSDQSGQVKVKYTGLQLTGFIANTNSIISLRSATDATLVAAPTTLWPQKAVKDNTNTYAAGFFIQGDLETDDRLRENNIPGQPHRWRVAGNYINKTLGNQGRLRCFITNPDTGFKVSSNAILPSGVITDDFTFEFTSIADNDSLASGRGYQLGFQTTFSDSSLIINVNSITRISDSIDPFR